MVKLSNSKRNKKVHLTTLDEQQICDSNTFYISCNGKNTIKQDRVFHIGCIAIYMTKYKIGCL